MERNILKLELLERSIYEIYRTSSENLPFHGLHHVFFVRNKAVLFAQELKADNYLVNSAALVHDLNYFVKKNSHAKEGKELRETLLRECNFNNSSIEKIENIVYEAHIQYRNNDISIEAKALSDADTLYKALPITPILFAQDYMSETGVTIDKLANTIIKEQGKLMEQSIYFYTDSAKKLYNHWGETNIHLWQNVIECLKDEDVIKAIKTRFNTTYNFL